MVVLMLVVLIAMVLMVLAKRKDSKRRARVIDSYKYIFSTIILYTRR